ncbi:long-chain fatty acid transport protein [Thioflavicoccus mobilis 8321]|uniref:Long-chain fatty acid transport protein n=1 Tax=Thioflavicoccus mobilis 8321 TaxID=765912 RepID=L0GZG3_9GAMM|nr:porin [Thioflavicoccus mobilis]AGA91356.1 long-chain fatty acid transport protein [Thioflavicoccus mobilis 8321]
MYRTISTTARLALIGIPIALAAQPSARASGFAVPENSAAGIGTANALVANPDDPGAFTYNPAAMGFHDDSSIAIGALFIGPSFQVTNSTGTHDSEGADWIGAPMIQGALKINDKWRLGLGVNAPFGLETRWEKETFPALTKELNLGPITIPLSPQPLQSKLEIIDVVPTVTYRVNDQLSLAAGVDYYWAKSAVLDSTQADLEGDGDGWGYNLSFLFKQDALSIGGSFHSAATVDIEGEVTPLILGIASQSAQLDLNLPWRLQLGVRYALTDQLAVEFDWTRTGWSEFDKIAVKPKGGGPAIQEDINDWSDANAYRLGLTYQWRPATVLRLGYSYDETGQGDSYFSARVPDNDRHLFGIGIGQELGNGWALDVGYMYVLFEDRNYESTSAYSLLDSSAINGTNAIDGDYEASAHLFGLEIRRTF